MRDYFSNNRTFVDLIPSRLRNDTNMSIMQNLFDRFLTKEESIPMFGFIGKNTTAESIQRLPQMNLERSINTLIPTYVFQTGSQSHYFTPNDFILKMKNMGVRDVREWLRSPGNNYVPPIDLNKFVNFYEYSWVGNALKNPPSMPWNPENAPEYYTIARPAITASKKLNVQCATTSLIAKTGSGYFDLDFIVEFQSSTNFTITAEGNTFGLVNGITQSFKLREILDNNTSDVVTEAFQFVSGGDVLLSINITRERVVENTTYYQTFYPGDKFTINCKFIDSAYYVAFNGAAGDLRRGGISSVRTLSTYQKIDGYQVREGDRVLVKDGANQSIYVVSRGDWKKSEDAFNNDGDHVFCESGVLNSGHLFSVINGEWVDSGASSPITNDWQERNYWVHKSVFDGPHDYDLSKVEQARRPIIEFWDGIQLNVSVDDYNYVQTKNRFNQIPLFDLFEYDGKSSGYISSLFFYVEDVNAEIDVLLQKRVKLTSSEDFVFEHGMVVDDRLMFFKHEGNLKTIWHGGYAASSIISIEFAGQGNGQLNVVSKADQQQQILSFVYTGDSVFSIHSSKYSDPIGSVTMDVPFNNFVCSGKITTGTVPFKTGDVFLVMVSGSEHTREIDIVNGAEVGVIENGGIKYPRMFSHNPLNVNSGELMEGSLYGHFRSILLNQVSDNKDYAFGGTIKTWNSPVSLLSSLLMQRGMTPLELIDFAKREYENSLNNINEIYFTNIIKYLISSDNISSGLNITHLTNYILKIVENDSKTKNIFVDTTSGVVGMPISLAKMGFVPAVSPEIIFDGELSTWFIKHHDGHLNPIFVSDAEFLDLLFEQRVKAVFPDLISDYQPVEPSLAKGKIWRYTENRINKIKVFCVEVASASQPKLYSDTGSLLWKQGDVWCEIQSKKIYRFDAVSVKWVLTTENHSSFWKVVDFAEILNQVILEVETRLFDNIDVFASPKVNPDLWDELPYKNFLQQELASWAFKNKLDPTANMFDQKNAFSWNFKNANIPGVTSPKARWFDVLRQHQASVGAVIPTERPDLYPWKLLGLNNKPQFWDSQYASGVDANLPFTSVISAKCVETNRSSLNFGTRIIDNVMVKAGDIILVTRNFVSSRNGLWKVTDGEWQSIDVPPTTKITILSGSSFSGTEWFNLNGELKQSRKWTTEMWEFIKSQRPTLKLSVNKYNDHLLPPYVNPNIQVSDEALTTTIPSGITLPFSFGDKSQVENLWMKSIEFPYALAKALFKYNPLDFLTSLWGLKLVNKSGIVLDLDTLKPFTVKSMLKHGTLINSISRQNSISFANLNTLSDRTISLEMVGVSQNSQIFKLMFENTVVAYFAEGQSISINSDGVVIENLIVDDQSKPFNLGDTFILTTKGATTSLTIEFVPAKFIVQNGFGQLFGQALRSVGVDSEVGYASSAMSGWDSYLGYRVGGFMEDDVSIETSLNTIEANAFKIVTKKTENFSSSWVTALRVSTIKVGADSKKVTNGYVPNRNGDDWVFRIEGYNPHHNQINFYTFNKSGHFNTFNAIEKAHTNIDWKQYTESLALQTVTLPVTIIGIQNVLNFVFGYEMWLKEQGWDFDNKVSKNADTYGRYLDFQYLLEKFIDGIFASGDVGRGEILNPIAGGVWFNHPQGLLSSFVSEQTFDPNTNAAAYDTFGLRINYKDLEILRQREQSLISANTPIFSIHAEVTAYEHLIVFNRYIDTTLETGTIYEPFQGSMVSFLKLNGKKQASSTLRPEMGGYFLQGDKLIPNLESNISDIGKMYDANHVFENKEMSNHALALYGYNKKSYMHDMDYTEKTQFNFWRGMIHMKGTNMSFDAFKNGNRFDDARLDEYWAYKIAEYGDARTKIVPELILRDSDCQQQFTKVTFNGQLDETFVNVSTTDESRWFESGDLGALESFQMVQSKTNYITISQSDVDNGTIFQFENSGDFVSFSPNLTKINHTCFIANSNGDATVSYSNIDFNKHSPLRLFNFVENENVQTIPVWHPLMGKHNPTALVAIDIVSDLNPAKYSYSTIINGNVNYDPFSKWGQNEVGLVWLDTSKMEYLAYNDVDKYPTVAQRLNRWGAMAEFGEINVAEWVESSVSPQDYETLSSSTDVTVRTDGIPYNPKTYKRNRLWSIAPIAWSKSGVPNENAHPSFNGSFNFGINFRPNGVISLEKYTFSSLGITAGMRIGAWKDDIEFTGPLNEFIVSDSPYTKFFMKNGQEYYGDNLTINGVACRLNISVAEYTDSEGSLELVFNNVTDVVETPILNYDGSSSGESTYSTYIAAFVDNQSIGLTLIGSLIGPSGTIPEYNFKADVPFSIILSNGISLELVPSSDFACGLDVYAAILDALFMTPVIIEDAIYVEEVTVTGLEPSSMLPFPSTLVNDPEDPRYAANNYCGWRAWSVPTQTELDNDAEFPNSQWHPYVGEYQLVPSPSIELIDDAISNGVYTLNDGTLVNRYQTAWTEWVELTNEVHKMTSSGGDVLVMLSGKFESSRLFVYKNGVRQSPGSFSVYGSAIQIPDTNIGDDIHMIVSKYQPTSEELAFNPDVSDDLKKQSHYKKDYEYVEVPIRNTDGVITDKKYYFWVTNKSNTKSKLPTNTLTEMLRDGPSQFVLFPRSDSMVIYGLNYLVAKNNTFKLRLIDDNTLRDDPNGLDLKNVHEEWTLIRKGQRNKIPEQLWNKIVDSVCGFNIANQELPYRSIQEYDARNHTSSIYGFGEGQVIAPRDVLVKTIFETITNSRVTLEFDLTGAIDFISQEVLDWNNSHLWFDTPEHTRKTMEKIWAFAKNSQINEIVFAAIEDACAYIDEMTHLIKTSRLSAYSVRMIQPSSAVENYE